MGVPAHIAAAYDEMDSLERIEFEMELQKKCADKKKSDAVKKAIHKAETAIYDGKILSVSLFLDGVVEYIEAIKK